MKIEKTEVYGFGAAIRGARNPMNSWGKSDTKLNLGIHDVWGSPKHCIKCVENPFIGPNDMNLLLRLIKAGGEHRKFLRMICIWTDVTLPLYIYSELDTYKISTVRNSCSTMHKLGRRELGVIDFQDDDVEQGVLIKLNEMAKKYIETKDFNYVRKMKKDLPCGYLMKSTYHMNYENALNMLHQRQNHRLPEWSAEENSLCEWMFALPYMKEFSAVFHKTQCPECLNNIEKEDAFCKYCGAKQPEKSR